MKKILFTTVCVAAFGASPVRAEDFHTYMGLDLQRINVNYNDSYAAGGGKTLNGNSLLNSGLDGADIHIGERISKYLGLELGYFRTLDETKNIAAGATVGHGVIAGRNFSTTARVDGFTLDALGYLPLGEGDKFDLIGTAGVIWDTGRAEVAVPGFGSGSVDKSEFDYRIGAGAQYNITDKVNIRGLMRYQSADFSNVVNNAWVYTLGANYTFN